MGDLRSARGDWGSSLAGRTSIINHASLEVGECLNIAGVSEQYVRCSHDSSNLCV